MAKITIDSEWLEGLSDRLDDLAINVGMEGTNPSLVREIEKVSMELWNKATE